jgi:hypothetical protein
MVEHTDEKILEMVGKAKQTSVKMGLVKVLEDVQDLGKIYKDNIEKMKAIMGLKLHVCHAIEAVANINWSDEN